MLTSIISYINNCLLSFFELFYKKRINKNKDKKIEMKIEIWDEREEINV